MLSKTLLSEVTLVDKDFDSYRIVDGSQELIFPLKELKAVIGLAEALSLPVNIYFNAEGGTYEASCFAASLTTTQANHLHDRRTAATAP